MTVEEFHDKITHIVDDARSPDQSRIWSDEFFKELEEEKKIYARLKCLEAIENTKNKVCEELESLVWPFSYNAKILNYPPTQLIQNISNQDVMPEL